MAYELYQYQVQTSRDERAVTIRPGNYDVTTDGIHYKRVAVIDADTLEDAFVVGNVGPESNIVREARMHSISVGDIVVDESGKAMMVAPMGYAPVLLNEAVRLQGRG